MTLNKVTLIGRLGRDPEARTTSSGQRVVNIRMATSERWKNQAGERVEKTEWHTVVIWNEHLGKIAEQFLKKGHQVYIEGQLQTREYDKDGTKHYVTEVVLQKFGGDIKLLANERDDERPQSGSVQRGGTKSPPPKKNDGFADDLDDDIPF